MGDEGPVRVVLDGDLDTPVAEPAVASLALMVVAFTSAPLGITVDRVAVAGVATVDGGLSYRSVEVTVQNHSDGALVPHFIVSSLSLIHI